MCESDALEYVGCAYDAEDTIDPALDVDEQNELAEDGVVMPAIVVVGLLTVVVLAECIDTGGEIGR